jgi:hypothetical protein
MKLRILRHSIGWRVAQSGLARIAADGHPDDGILVERISSAWPASSSANDSDSFVNPPKSAPANH